VNILIILEDFRKDQHIVKPIIEAMLARVGKPHAKVLVCREYLGGIAKAKDWGEIEKIIYLHRSMTDLLLLLVDRDGVATRRAALDKLETRAAEILPQSRRFMAENAWQEIEAWALAGLALPTGWKIRDIRNHEHSKEAYFEPLVRRMGLAEELGGGRATLGREAARHYSRIRSRCPEDIATLENRIRDWLESI
jgi:hypothetical protein